MSTLVSEHRLILREFATPDGTQIKLHIEGDGVDAPDTEVATLGYEVAATLFQLYANGTVLEAMANALGFNAEGIAIKLETEYE